MPLLDAAIDKLITDHLTRTRAVALSIASMYHDVDRDEAIACANLALVEAARRYQEQGHKFWTYARHSIIGAVRELARPDELPMDRDAEALAPDSDVEPRIFASQLLADLDERARHVLIAHYWHDHALCEIAEAMRLSPARVGQIRCEALNQLRTRLGAQVATATEHPALRALASPASRPPCPRRPVPDRLAYSQHTPGSDSTRHDSVE